MEIKTENKHVIISLNKEEASLLCFSICPSQYNETHNRAKVDNIKLAILSLTNLIEET